MTNNLFQGDNLTIMRDLPDASVDLICTDPPFNTGKDWGAFTDKWEGGLKGYLKFMEARVVEMRRVLKSTGSLYLHCDPTASHYLKVMLDGVFGIKQFRNEIVWERSSGSGHSTQKHKFRNHHDIILFYAKANNAFHRKYKPLSPMHIKDAYTRVDENGRRYSRHEVYNGKRIYLDENKGALIGSIWLGKSISLSGFSKERLGYPTQKPLALYARMIQASSNQHDIVLDPFAGSGTTLDAAHTLGRHWIGIDIGDEAIETIINRMRTRHGLEYDRDYQLTT